MWIWRSRNPIFHSFLSGERLRWPCPSACYWRKCPMESGRHVFFFWLFGADNTGLQHRIIPTSSAPLPPLPRSITTALSSGGRDDKGGDRWQTGREQSATTELLPSNATKCDGIRLTGKGQQGEHCHHDNASPRFFEISTRASRISASRGVQILYIERWKCTNNRHKQYNITANDGS